MGSDRVIRIDSFMQENRVINQCGLEQIRAFVIDGMSGL